MPITFVRMLLDRSQRRALIRRFYQHGALWGLGNGLVGSALITYLANLYGAKGFYTGLVLAAPRFVGVLRLATPLWIDRVGSTKRVCTGAFLSGSLVLLLLPAVSSPGVLVSGRSALVALVAMWTLYHLFKYVSMVSLWSWIGETIPVRVRGRFIGRRAALLNACEVISLIGSGLGNMRWRAYCQEVGRPEDFWYGYIVCVCLGALFTGLAVWPLWRAPDSPERTARGQTISQAISQMFVPFGDLAFWRFLIYGSWFSLSNGLVGSAMYRYRIGVLDISYGAHLTMDGASQGAQSLIMPGCGRALDRKGGVPVLAVSQFFVALAFVFFLLATPEYRWWIIGAYAMNVAYAGTNTAIPKLILGFSPAEHYAAYSAAWFGCWELVYAVSSLAGGVLFDWLSKNFQPRDVAGWTVDHFVLLFSLGLVLRLIGVFWAARIREPN